MICEWQRKLVGCAALAVLTVSAFGEQAGFDFRAVRELARQLAEKPYEEPGLLPRNLTDLSYDELRNIRFDPKEAVWRRERLPFQLQFFHPGSIQRDRVKVNLVEGELTETVPFSKGLFNYEKVKVRGSIADDVGFAGFRIHYPLNRPDYLDELIVFQGASYFRALGRGQHYGLSSRGLAVKVAAEEPEEFPRFREFWVERPDRSATQLRLYALLDSPSVTGAYEFLLTPGGTTTTDIKAALFARRPLSDLGLAPLTSMFWYGENSPSRFNDFRPEVHDSDGVVVHTGAGEWLWRPLVNEARYRFASFVDENPKGFGLFQRDRRYTSYEDIEALYHMRPSVWVQPLGDWGGGELRLIEIPTTHEYADNIVLLWKPRNPLTPGKPLEYAYRLSWLTDEPGLPPKARCLATRMGDIPYMPGAKKVVLDFGGNALLDETGAAELQADVAAANGAVMGSSLVRNPFTNTWRLAFDVKPEDKTKPVEMRAFLKTAKEPLSETWTYLWIP